jgi:hypothetical protein
MSSIDNGNIETKVQSAINEFNTQTGQLNVGSTPPVIPPLIDTYTYAVTTPPLFENLKVIVDPSVDGLRNIFQIEYGYKITAECHEGSGSGQQFGTNYVSTNKQKFEIDLQGLLTESGCNNVSKSEYTGTYKYISFFNPEVGYKWQVSRELSIDPSMGCLWKIEFRGTDDVDNRSFSSLVPRVGIRVGYSF